MIRFLFKHVPAICKIKIHPTVLAHSPFFELLSKLESASCSAIFFFSKEYVNIKKSPSVSRFRWVLSDSYCMAINYMTAPYQLDNPQTGFFPLFNVIYRGRSSQTVQNDPAICMSKSRLCLASAPHQLSYKYPSTGRHHPPYSELIMLLSREFFFFMSDLACMSPGFFQT